MPETIDDCKAVTEMAPVLLKYLRKSSCSVQPAAIIIPNPFGVSSQSATSGAVDHQTFYRRFEQPPQFTKLLQKGADRELWSPTSRYLFPVFVAGLVMSFRDRLM